MALTNLGFCMLVYTFLLNKRDGLVEFSREHIYHWCANRVTKLEVSPYILSTPVNAQKIIKSVVTMYETKKIRKEIPVEEYGAIWWMFKYFAHTYDDDTELVKIDVRKIEEFIEEYFNKVSMLLFISAGDPETRMFPDPMVDYFYQQMKEDFNYYKAFKKLGVLERDIDALIDTKPYQEAMKRARRVIDTEVESQNTQKARFGEDNASINTYLRQKQIRDMEAFEDDVEDWEGVTNPVSEGIGHRKPPEKEITIPNTD